MDNEVEYKEIPREKKVRKKKHYFLKFIIVIGVAAALIAFLMSPVFNIKSVKVEGNSYYSKSEIINIANATKGQNIFLHTGASSIKERLEANPYFSEVKVHRSLPSTVIIKVNERKQVAAFIYGNQYVVIDVNGRVLRMTSVNPKITLLRGLTLSRIKIGEKIKAEQGESLKNTLAMVSTMKKGNLYFKKIDVSSLFIKAYIYDTLIVKGTPEQMKKSIDCGGLQKVVSQLFGNGYKRGTITLGDHNYISFSPGY